MKKIFFLVVTLCTLHFTASAQTSAVAVTTAKQDAAKLDPRMTRTTPLDSNSDRSSRKSKKHKSKSEHKSKKHKKRKASDD